MAGSEGEGGLMKGRVPQGDTHSASGETQALARGGGGGGGDTSPAPPCGTAAQ